MAAEDVGVAAGVPVLAVGERRLGDERAQPCVVGFALELGQLLLGDEEVGTELLQAIADLDEATLHEGSRHGRSVGGPRRCPVVPWGPWHPARVELRRIGPAATAALLLLVPGTACAGDAGAAEGCADPVEEELDPAVLLHVLPDSPVTYLTDPPTSGPHAGAAPRGAVDEVLPGAVQVAVLERGDVLVQYDPGLGEEAVAFLRDLAGDRVVTAPNDALPSPVVATAWRWKLLCDGIDLDALDRFTADRAGAVDGH